MPLFARGRSCLRNLFATRSVDFDLDEEMQAHLDMLSDENVLKGMSQQEAQRAARIELGGFEQVKEQVREQRIGTWVLSVTADCRYGLWQLRKNPGFTAVALLTLVLSIGANTAIFSLLDQAILRKLPVAQPNRLALVRYSGTDTGASYTRGDHDFYFSYPMYRDLRDRNSVFSGLLATAWTQVGVQWRNEPEPVNAELVSGNYFEVLGLQPAFGRLLAASDDLAPEANPVVVLSFDYWQRRFASDANIVGQSILVNGHPFTVLGVTQPDFHSVVSRDVPAIFLPMMMKPQATPGWNDLDERRSKWLNIVGRLKPGLDASKAQAGLDPLWHSIRASELEQLGHSSEEFKSSFLTNSHIFLDDGSKGVPVHGSSPTTLLIAMAMAALLILMACTNIGTLLLVRAAARSREISVRLALGASRNRVAQQLIVEGLVLGLAGGLSGMFLAPQITAVLTRTIWGDLSGTLAFSSHLDLRVLLFNFVLAILVSLLFSLAPIHLFWRPDLTPALTTHAGGIGRSALGLRRVLVVAQISLSFLLVVGAGLLTRTLLNLKSVPVGFATDHLVTFSIDTGLAGYEPDHTEQIYHQILDNVSQLPGVRSVTATNDPELANSDSGANITIAAYSPADGEDMNVEWAEVTPAFFSTLNMPLLAGREITEQDRRGTQKVAVVNQTFVRRFFDGDPQKAIGTFFGKGAGDIKIDIQIIGVASDAKHGTLRQSIRPAAFLPVFQKEPDGGKSFGMFFYVRTWQAPEGAESAIRQSVHLFDSKLVLKDFRTMQEQIDETLVNERVTAFLASCFGALAAFMAAVGIFGVLAYATAQRTHEFGIRFALGATPNQVVLIVAREVLLLAGVGIAAGIPGSLLFANIVRSQLFGVSKSDPLTLATASLFIAIVALVAAAVPARRASRVDPMIALRHE
jgi:putative ABC transport system permease protein